MLPRPLADDMLRGALAPPPPRPRPAQLRARRRARPAPTTSAICCWTTSTTGAPPHLARRTGKPVHTIYLDELTYRLTRQWLAERHRRWPTTSPYLLVTAHTATDDIQPPVSMQAINKPLRAHGHQAGRLRVDRILNEAQHTDDPLRLIRLFGLSPRTAMQYIHAAHPHRSQSDPITS
ncbi:hypothetical protein [Streptomyces sp. NPDC050982]|uniref:hypothetical protein n=1 Tax=Streptomyces sp. NPDC050982 TaxID=3154746 RepID=UPI0033D29972